ncbi:MAG: DUF5597 domain-containing protein [Armatimonadota bacterium]|nr:MAG: DUF5597 domain-containing protein [Armatimonadota bacterium]
MPITQSAATVGLIAAVVSVLLMLSAAPTLAAAGQAPSIPEIVHSDGQYRLMVDGQPFLALAGQAHNSSASNRDDIERACQAVTAIHGNLLIIPIYWELIEPRPGQFDFQVVDDVIAAARRHELRLVLLWFATWKNGEMNYAPEWVKADRKRFRRVIGLRGEELNVISPLCKAARDADASAFAAVMQHIREIDETQRTVIMVQVENEPGLMGSDRDYSTEATRLFNRPVPASLMSYLDQHREGLSESMQAAWGASGYRSQGTWAEVFGRMATEAFSAWHIARYIDRVAAAGKQAYPLPMYANAWLVEPHVERPGRWPSGGPTEHVLDIWKAAAPHLDLLAPDIYYPKFYDNASHYARPDNPLFVPEVNFHPFFGALVFMTFATFDGICFSPFGIDDALQDGELSFKAAEFEDAYRVLRPLLPLVLRYQYTGKLHAVIQGIGPGEHWAQCVALGGRTVAAMVEFTVTFDPEKGRGRGMMIELAPDDYVIAGAGFKVAFRTLQGPLRDVELVSVEEGTFEGERWIPERQLTGDELRVHLPEQSKILRVRVAAP